MTNNSMVRLADIVLRLGTVNRQTEDSFGHPESDTTHTLMLLMICRTLLGSCLHPHCGCKSLDWATVDALCMVHDLVEFKHGDISTLRITHTEAKSKLAQEADALGDLDRLFPDSWVTSALNIYHDQKSPTARYVRAMDKNLPKLTHINNNCAVLHRLGMTREEFRQRILVQQSADISEYAGEFLCVMEMHHSLGERIAAMLPEGNG